MSLILNIDTSGETGMVALSRQGIIVQYEQNEKQQEHASFLQPAIAAIMQRENATFSDLAAVAVGNGPGSYTGLRVGLASAKGICFAAQLPLITISSLEILAAAMKQAIPVTATDYLLCPMIDARRMEVFMALYNADLQCLQEPSAVVLTPELFYNAPQVIYVGGNGASKFLSITPQPEKHIGIDAITYYKQSLAVLAWEHFQRARFADLAYSEPFYSKAFYSPPRQH
ncbi:MAG TPA: tRNA (adenosine(37)-N6)-threonylcarbamoyltransferase complex dimerization subunit type 1 TsaB [Phnomibacter sp.]|nr:tRNA (adenosine(37)-N6)-threonylcarbamoyltransferase complex dimerization subunit type 1 TsaB [Phnomibacter sp.]